MCVASDREGGREEGLGLGGREEGGREGEREGGSRGEGVRGREERDKNT